MAIDLTAGMIAATVEIDQPQADGKRTVGTGFLIQDPRPDGTPRTVLITAGHVFENMPGPSARIGYRFQGDGGVWRFSAQPLAIRDGAKPLWVRNPNRDIAVIAIEAPPEFARAAIPLAWLADDTAFDRSGVATGDEMFVLGFPEGLAANGEGFPILRSGRVASYPLTPVAQFPNFLLDFRVFSGNSGGPVFITSDMLRHPVPDGAKGDFVAGLLAQQTTVGDEKLELGIVINAVFIRQTLALLDIPGAPTAPATPPAAPSAAEPPAAKQVSVGR